MTGRRVLVTGASGFVGSHVARRLVAHGDEVHVLGRATTDLSRLADVRDAIVAHVADLRDPAGIATMIGDVRPDRVFHLAAATMHAGRAPDAQEQIATNLGGTVALLHLCRDQGVEAFVNVGDAFEYGPNDGPVAETTPPRPVSIDGITKLAATLYGCALSADDLRVVTVRPFSIVGPGDDSCRLVPRLVETARANGRLALSDRRVVRDFVRVHDLVDLLLLVADHVIALRGRVLNGGSGVATTLAALVDTVERVTGATVAAEWGAFPVAAHDLRHPIADTAATRAFGWRATTSLDRMIALLWSDPAGQERGGSAAAR